MHVNPGRKHERIGVICSEKYIPQFIHESGVNIVKRTPQAPKRFSNLAIDIDHPLGPDTENEGCGRVVFNDWGCDVPPTIACNDLELSWTWYKIEEAMYTSMCITCLRGQ